MGIVAQAVCFTASVVLLSLALIWDSREFLSFFLKLTLTLLAAALAFITFILPNYAM